MVIVVTGVSGAGKTTIGSALAADLRFEFYEGDDFHPPANRAKMAAGTALTDEDREPWLAALSALIDDLLICEVDSVLSCSALRRMYREQLSRADVRFVQLRVPFAVVQERLQDRKGHFFDPGLLASQFAALEEGDDQLCVDASQPVAKVIVDVEKALGLGSQP